MNKKITNYIENSVSVKNAILQNNKIIENISAAVNLILDTYKLNGKVLVAGNGGSAADAQHIAGELVSKFFFDRDGLPAIALTTDTSIITAIGNDYGFEKLFERQLQANATKNDVFIGITTSGTSKNLVKAFEFCKKNGIKSIALIGENDSVVKDLCDVCIAVPSPTTPHVQESHIMIGHVMCALVEEAIFKNK